MISTGKTFVDMVSHFHETLDGFIPVVYTLLVPGINLISQQGEHETTSY